MFGMILAAALVPATGGGCGECASLWRDSKAMWETPKTYPIDGQGGADVKAMALPVMRHRISTTFNAEAAGVTPDSIVERLLNEVKSHEELDV